MKFKLKSDIGLILLFAFLYVVIILAFGLFNIFMHEKYILGRIDKNLVAGARMVLLTFPEGFHDRAVDKSSVSAKEDMDNITRLTEIQKITDLTYLYTVISKNGKIYFTSSGASADELKNGTYVRYFNCYDDAPEALKKVLESGETVFSEYTDKWGTFRSVFIPMKNSRGETYAVCADIEAKRITDLQRTVFWSSMFFPLMFILLAVPLVMMLGKIRMSYKNLMKENNVHLEHASRLTVMGEMAAGIAHEINQPLCVLRGYLELMQISLKNNPILQERQLGNAFEICIKSVEKVSAIIKHMRSFVKLKTEEHPVPIDLTEVLNEALNFFNEQIRLHNIELSMNYENGAPLVKIDPRKFEQIAVNIISNARFALDRKGELEGRSFKKKLELHVSSSEDGSEVVFRAIDNGTGMPKDILKRCREPFFSSKFKQEGEGLGLGLSIVENLAKEAGGRLEINSTEGQGTEVRISFPAALK